MDNINTRKVASLYKRHNPEEARHIKNKMEILNTPKQAVGLILQKLN